MLAKYLVPAVAAIGSVAAQSSCTASTTTIHSPSEATGLATNCRTFNGDVLVAPDAAGTIDFNGLGQIKGNLIAKSAGSLTGISANSLNSITGDLELANLTGLGSLSFLGLKSVGSIKWTALTVLDSLTLGTPGIQTAKTIIIQDCFLSSLEGIDVTTAADIDINNCRRLNSWDSKLTNLTNKLNFLANGVPFNVSMPKLTWIANMTVNNVSSIDLPALQTVNGSADFRSNQFTSFMAPNLTSTKSGSLVFVSNNLLTNVSVPQLTSLGGGLLIANNTQLDTVDGFPKLKTVSGDIKLRGNFSDINFPALNDVKGAFDISSTNDISGACDKFGKLAPSKQGGNGQIQGVYHCESNNEQANSDTGGNTSSSGTPGGSGKGGGNSAAGVAINGAILGLAVVGGLVALL